MAGAERKNPLWVIFLSTSFFAAVFFFVFFVGKVVEWAQERYARWQRRRAMLKKKN